MSRQLLPAANRPGLAEIDPNRVILPQPIAMKKPGGSLYSAPYPTAGFAPGPLPVPVPVPVIAAVPAVPELAPSRKRKSDALEAEPSTTTTPLPAISNQAPRPLDVAVADDCDAVRRKIRHLVASGEMKVGEFQRAIGVSPTAYSTFMKQDGPDAGQRCSAYKLASDLFKKREKLQGPPVSVDTPAQPAKKAKKDDAAQAMDLFDITLPGEEDGTVPVYDTCNDIRTKFRAVLQKDGVTQAGFCREVTKMVEGRGRKVSPASLAKFMRQQGPTAGAGSVAFYASYVYFEKHRVRDGAPKSQMRKEMEDIWGVDGLEIPEGNGGGYTYCIGGGRPVEDKYGRVRMR